MDIVRTIMEEFRIPTTDPDASLMELFGDEFSPRWGEVIAAIEDRAGIVLAPEDLPSGMRLGQLVAKVDEKRRTLVS